MSHPAGLGHRCGRTRSNGEETLPAATQELVKIRASQINGCAFCLDMHTKDAQQPAGDYQPGQWG